MVFIVVFASDYDDDVVVVVVVVVDLDVGDLNVENLVVIWYSGLERQSASRQTARQTLNNSMCAFLTINVRKSKKFSILLSSFLSDNTSSVGAEGKLYLAESSLISRQKTSQGQRVVVTSIILRPWPCQHAPC